MIHGFSAQPSGLTQHVVRHQHAGMREPRTAAQRSHDRIVGGSIVGGLIAGGVAGALGGPRLLKLAGAGSNRTALALVGAALLGLAGGVIGKVIAQRRTSDTGSSEPGSLPSPVPFDPAAPFGRESDNPRPQIPATPSQERVPRTVTGVTGGDAVNTAAPFKMQVVSEGLAGPVQVTSAPGDTALYVVEAEGRIKRVNGTNTPTSFVDISSVVGAGGERGLLSVAFHPEYATNGRLFVNYTDTQGDTHVAELTARAGVVDPSSLRDVLVIDQPYGNHNGGQLQFGPDGYLYIGMGDGGAGGDPENRSQDPATLLGKMLRIDVNTRSAGKPYGIPADNPFANSRGGKPEIYALGVRNPWRFSFDRSTGDMWIGDVGQNRWEEINFIPRGTGAGTNLGWDVREGSNVFEDKHPGPGRLVDPVLQYSHDEGAAVTGGFVYRGTGIPELYGYYLYSDYARSSIRAIKVEDGQVVDRREYEVDQRGIVSFGEGPNGELYATSLDGKLLQIAPRAGTGAQEAGNVSGDVGEPTPVDARRADVQYVALGTQPDGAMRFDQDVIRVKPGKVEIDFTNTDYMPHNVVVQGSGVNARTKQFAEKGGAQRVEFVAAAGQSYEFYCEPHVGLGMKGRIIVDPA